MRKAVLFKKLANEKVQCTACSWYCRINPDEVGVCATRLNKAGELYSLVYGKAIGLAIDPVEKKPLYHYLPGSQFLSFGTVGCNFGCLFCQNVWMSQVNKRSAGSGQRAEELISLIDKLSEDVSPKEIVEMAVENGCRGIAYTYNEPAIFPEYAHDTMELAKEKGLKNVYVSNGFESQETFEYLKKYLDAINIDLKSFRDEFYREVCKAKIGPVKENIKHLFGAGIETEVTTLVIPGYNDTDKELTEIAQFLVSVSAEIPWHISAYSPAYMFTAPPTPHDTLVRAYEIGKRAGLKYVYLGNAHDEKMLSTWCPKCERLLVKRRWHGAEVINLDIKKGKCKDCGEKIYGEWY